MLDIKMISYGRRFVKGVFVNFYGLQVRQAL